MDRMKISQKDIRIITENVVKNELKKLSLQENYESDDEDEEDNDNFDSFDYYMEYENDYPNEDFSPENITINDLIKFCRTSGDFLFIDQGLQGWKLFTASSPKQVYAILSDLSDCSLSLTHELDYLIWNKLDFEHYYIAVFNIQTYEKNYYIVYEQPKEDL